MKQSWLSNNRIAKWAESEKKSSMIDYAYTHLACWELSPEYLIQFKQKVKYPHIELLLDCCRDDDQSPWNEE